MTFELVTKLENIEKRGLQIQVGFTSESSIVNSAPSMAFSAALQT